MNSIYVKTLSMNDAGVLFKLFQTEHEHLQDFHSFHLESLHTLDLCQKEIASSIIQAQKDQSYLFGIFLTETDGLIGIVALTDIKRGIYQNANIEHFLSNKNINNGITTKAVFQILCIALNTLKLNRIQAIVSPKNHPAIQVLEKNYFKRVGLSNNYLKINDKWEDRLVFAVTQLEFADSNRDNPFFTFNKERLAKLNFLSTMNFYG